MKQNNIVEATAVNYRVIGREKTAYPQLGFYYEYVDENGIKYSGSTTRTVVYGYLQKSGKPVIKCEIVF